MSRPHSGPPVFNRERPGRRTHTMRLFATLLCVIGALPVVASDVQAEQARAMLQEILEHIPGVDQESIDEIRVWEYWQSNRSSFSNAPPGDARSRLAVLRPRVVARGTTTNSDTGK